MVGVSVSGLVVEYELHIDTLGDPSSVVQIFCGLEDK